MSTTTQTAIEDLSVEQLFARREALIEAFNAESANAEAAMERAASATAKKAKDEAKAEAASANAKKANRSREIGEVQLYLAAAGAKFKEWVKPTSRTSRTRRREISEDQIVADLEKMGRIFNGDFSEDMKSRADNRIRALLKQAETRGYKVKDPRKGSK